MMDCVIFSIFMATLKNREFSKFFNFSKSAKVHNFESHMVDEYMRYGSTSGRNMVPRRPIEALAPPVWCLHFFKNDFGDFCMVDL